MSFVILALMGQLPFQVTAAGGAYLQPNIADHGGVRKAAGPITS
jgi:hypothetical protein